MPRRILAAIILLSAAAAHAAVELRFLPEGAKASAIATDSAGNLCVAGATSSKTDAADAFVARLSPDGSRILAWTALHGSGSEYASAIAVGADDSIYVTGWTSSPDFPVSAGAMKTAYEGDNQGFAAKVDTAGGVVWSTYFGGAKAGSGASIAVNDAGEALISGNADTTFAATGSYSASGQAILLKLNAQGTKALFALQGLGGNLAAYDQSGAIIVTGYDIYGYPSSSLPTPGALQTTHEFRACGGTGMVGFACAYPYVAKLSADGANLLWATFVTGTWGSSVRALNVDAEGAVLLAGSTNSSDYPVTSGAFQTAYTVTAQPPIQAYSGPHPAIYPPPSTGFVTKLNSTGTALIWSTLLSGTSIETLTGMAVDRAGAIHVTGIAGSHDFPGLADVPSACRPALSHAAVYLATLDPSGAKLVSSQPVNGFATCYFCELAYTVTPQIAARPDGSLALASATDVLADVHLDDPATQACLVDGADGMQISRAAPGQLISMFGSKLAADTASFTGDRAPAELAGASISIGAQPAAMLYASPGQINFQVPYEVAGSTQLRLATSADAASGPARNLAIVARQPTLFAMPEESCAATPPTLGAHAFALNADGTVNSCANPAVIGATVSLFLNGVGVTDAPLATGVVNTVALESVTLPVSVSYLASRPPATPDAGSISSVWRVKLAPGASGYQLFSIAVDGVPGRQQAYIWTKSPAAQ
ncbi:MAG: hypothetical protein JSU00_13980 [Acidobacteria bacterium]|nr:hypothetical protein [Acidobacteriota bacterium]